MFVHSPAGILGESFLLSALFLPLIKKLSLRRRFLTSKTVPSVGGISMGLAFFLVLLLAGAFLPDFSREVKGILIASAVMLLAGIWDDHKEMSVMQKFLVQLLTAAILIAFGVRTDFAFTNSPVNMTISLLWIIGITNAINLLDVMDGLAGGATLAILSGFCVIAAASGDHLTLCLSCALTGAVLGFWIYNLPPAKVYMGNTGSHFLGLILAAISLTARYATSDRMLALLTPVLLLGFPILDTLFLILMRLRKGQSAFNKSEDHMALRFLKQGYSKPRTLLVMMGWTLFFVGTGLVLQKVPNIWALLTLGVAGLVSFFLVQKMGRVQI